MRQKRECADGVIAATTPGAEQHDVGGASIKCGKQGKFGIGCIFIRSGSA